MKVLSQSFKEAFLLCDCLVLLSLSAPFASYSSSSLSAACSRLRCGRNPPSKTLRRSLRSSLVLFENDGEGSHENALERLSLLGCLLQLSPDDVQRDHHCPCGLLRGGFRGVIAGNEGAQLHVPPSQRLEPFKTLQKSLSRRYSLQPSRATEPVSRRHVTPFNRFRRFSPSPM